MSSNFFFKGTETLTLKVLLLQPIEDRLYALDSHSGWILVVNCIAANLKSIYPTK